MESIEEIRQNVDQLSNTGNIENILIAIAYWLAVIFVMIFIFYIALKINNYRQYRRQGKVEKDDFLN